jgi:hypothetical protein
MAINYNPDMVNGERINPSNGTNGAKGVNGRNGTNGTLLDLPDKRCPTLAIVHPTEEEKLAIWKKNGAEWRGALSMEAYLRREKHLANQPQTKDGGISYWILVDTAAKNRVVLSACDTYRKKALVARNGKVEQVVSHGIGSVFCPPECRRRGYAGAMMKMLGEKLRTYQATEGGKEECAFSILFSDIGKVLDSHYSHKAALKLTITRTSTRHTVGSHSIHHTSPFQHRQIPLSHPIQALSQ